MSRMKTTLAALAIAALSLLVMAGPSAAKVKTTLKLQAPAKVDQDKHFPVIATGKANRHKDHVISLYYRNDSAGTCADTVGEEATRTGHYSISYLAEIKPNKHNKYHYKSPTLFGGEAAKGQICGYISDKDGNTEVRKTKPIEFT